MIHFRAMRNDFKLILATIFMAGLFGLVAGVTFANEWADAQGRTAFRASYARTGETVLTPMTPIAITVKPVDGTAVAMGDTFHDCYFEGIVVTYSDDKTVARALGLHCANGRFTVGAMLVPGTGPVKQ